MKKFCTECGHDLPENVAFCTECGAKVESAEPQQVFQPEPQPVFQPEPQPAFQPMPQVSYAPVPAPPAASEPQPKEKPADKTVGTGTFFGLMLLFAIPVLGWLICLIMAFAAKNHNIRNFARATLIWVLIGLVLSALVALAVKALIGFITPYIQQLLNELGMFGEISNPNDLIGLISELGSLTDILGGLK